MVIIDAIVKLANSGTVGQFLVIGLFIIIMLFCANVIFLPFRIGTIVYEIKEIRKMLKQNNK